MAFKQPEPQKTPPRPEPAPPQPAKKSAPRPTGEVAWHPFWRWSVSLLIVLHLLAVFSAPWDLATLPALPPGYVAPADNLGRELPPPPANSNVWQQPVVPRALRYFFRHYLNLMYLNHGYEFFAPDPAGSNLIRYQVRDSGGKEIANAQFPDHKLHWPRLLYHRYLMLAAQTGDMGEESGRNFAQHLLRVNSGQTIRLEWILHKLLAPQQVRDKTPLDAPNTYQVLATIQETPRQRSVPNPLPPVTVPGGGR